MYQIETYRDGTGWATVERHIESERQAADTVYAGVDAGRYPGGLFRVVHEQTGEVVDVLEAAAEDQP